MRDPYRKAYTQQKCNAKQRGVPFLLSFEEWKTIWLGSNKWDERGRGAAKYCMCRIGDAGAYEVGNVFIGLGAKNVRDGNLGKFDSDITRAKKSASLTGKPHPWSAGTNNVMHRPEVKAKISAATSGGKHYSARAVITPFGSFDSGTDAAIALNIPKPTIYWRCKYQKSGFAFA